MLNAIKALGDIAETLKTHPDINKGNSKVHYSFHLAKGALNTLLDKKTTQYAGSMDSRMDNDEEVIALRAALKSIDK